MKVPFCSNLSDQATGHDWATESILRAYLDNVWCRFAGSSRDGSDGTRTRDLRRDRLARPRRREPPGASNPLDQRLSAEPAGRRKPPNTPPPAAPAALSHAPIP